MLRVLVNKSYLTKGIIAKTQFSTLSVKKD